MLRSALGILLGCCDCMTRMGLPSQCIMATSSAPKLELSIIEQDVAAGPRVPDEPHACTPAEPAEQRAESFSFEISVSQAAEAAEQQQRPTPTSAWTAPHETATPRAGRPFPSPPQAQEQDEASAPLREGPSQGEAAVRESAANIAMPKPASGEPETEAGPANAMTASSPGAEQQATETKARQQQSPAQREPSLLAPQEALEDERPANGEDLACTLEPSSPAALLEEPPALPAVASPILESPAANTRSRTRVLSGATDPGEEVTDLAAAAEIAADLGPVELAEEALEAAAAGTPLVAEDELPARKNLVSTIRSFLPLVTKEAKDPGAGRKPVKARHCAYNSAT